ncbi:MULTISPECIES: GOLPH3/VPS74 family protein [unclassified Streptomyces]|uniref:GOLPH3/VPS74 family protein n=1 Tax=unclassified Streptomyces TaxID=2593676 RepID=UPI001C6F3C8A|nr:GPP34 family phosphoprotein [Streptomyces sp. MBT84]
MTPLALAWLSIPTAWRQPQGPVRRRDLCLRFQYRDQGETPMQERPFLTLPEELLLACGNPEQGLIRRPDFFNRALSGAVLAELELCGAITIEDAKIVELRPLTLGEPVIDALFEQLSSDIGLGQPETGQPRLVSPPDNLRRLRQDLPRGFSARVSAAMRIGLAAYLPNWPLHGWISTWPHFRDIEERCLAAMESRGLVIAHRRRFLGVVPRTSWSALSPEHARESADRIDEAVRAVTGADRSGRQSRRAVHLVALVGAAGLSERLYPGREHHATRRSIEEVTNGNPIATAVSFVREADERARRAND